MLRFKLFRLFFFVLFAGFNNPAVSEDVNFEEIANIVTRDGKIAKWIGDKPFIHFLGVKNQYVSDRVGEIMEAYNDVYEGGYGYYDQDGRRHPEANIIVLFYDNYDDFANNQKKYFEGYNDNLGVSFRGDANTDNKTQCRSRRYHSIPHGIAGGFILVNNSVSDIFSYNCVFDALYYLFGLSNQQDAVWGINVSKLTKQSILSKSFISKREKAALKYLGRQDILPGSDISN